MNLRVLFWQRIERQRDPELVDGNQRPHYRRPQTGKEKDAACSRNQAWCEDDRVRKLPGKTAGPEID